VTLTVTRGDRVDLITRDRLGNVAFRRLRSGSLIAAGMVGKTELRHPGIALTAPQPGSAYVKRDGERYAAASNCNATVTIPGADVRTVQWEGR